MLARAMALQMNSVAPLSPLDLCQELEPETSLAFSIQPLLSE